MADAFSSLDLSKIIKRLELIRNLVSLEEDQGIAEQIAKLKALQVPSQVQVIIELFENRQYGLGVKAAETFINEKQQLSKYTDPEIEGLKLEARSLEQQVNALSNEKADLDKLIHEFIVRHTRELGDLIKQILQFRKDQSKGTPQQEEAENDFNDFNKEYEIHREELIIELTDEEKKELKQKYRKASKFCHPDTVDEGQKELANKLFSELSAAYERNDLITVREILSKLEAGDLFINKSESINERQKLKGENERLRLRIHELQVELRKIRESESYQIIISVSDWDFYFNNTRQQLMEQLTHLQHG